jgi:hypothetical protein
VLAAGALVLLVAAGVLVFLLLRGGGGGGETAAVAAPAEPECVAAWNEDRQALSLGRHQRFVHGYTEVEVLRVSDQGDPVDAGGKGLCAVAFAGAALDAEPGYAVRVREGGLWQSLDAMPAVTSAQLLQMQTEAREAPNATLEDNGRLAPL